MVCIEGAVVPAAIPLDDLHHGSGRMKIAPHRRCVRRMCVAPLADDHRVMAEHGIGVLAFIESSQFRLRCVVTAIPRPDQRLIGR